MEQVEEPMDVDVSAGEVYKFDDLIDDKIKLNDATERRFHNDNEILNVPESRYENKDGTFLTGIDIFSKEEKLKKEERAKRFGLVDKVKISDSYQVQDLFTSLGIDKDCESIQNLRLNVIHMRGTENMSTQDVFKYFEYYAPASIEWINDVSCNVVWLDNVSAARALQGLSKKISGLEEQNKSKKSEAGNSEPSSCLDNDDGCVVEVIEEEAVTTKQEKTADEDAIDIKDINCPLPPGPWRKGVNCTKSKSIFLRFATRSDKKQQHAEKVSEYYKKYGNPNFGGEKGLLSQSRKRIYKQIRNKNRMENDTLNNGDDKIVKNPWGALSQNWGVNDFVENEFPTPHVMKDHVSGIKVRLGARSSQTREPSPRFIQSSDSETESNSEDDWCKRSKVLRMRMHADDEEEKIQKKRTKHHDQLSNIARGGDLRSRIIGKSKEKPIIRDAIQVVVMNTRAINNEKSNPDSEEEGEIVDEYDSDEKEERKEEEEKIIDDDEEEGEEEEAEEQEEGVDDNEESNSNSDISEKEVQGPKGSVIKVVPRKPRLASTVWARLNSVKSVVGENTLKERYPTRRDLRETIRGASGDLRSRLGSYVRGRSPLRIEVRNDKCAGEDSATE